GGGEEREQALVPLFVAANALELGERRVRVLMLGGEVAEPLPAERGGSLGVDIEPAEAPERAEAQLARHRAWHLPDERAGRREEGGEEARKGRAQPPIQPVSCWIVELTRSRRLPSFKSAPRT